MNEPVRDKHPFKYVGEVEEVEERKGAFEVWKDYWDKSGWMDRMELLVWTPLYIALVVSIALEGDRVG